jgi:microcystin-dependent protein
VIGTTYGGDGVKSFALPNLTGRVAVGPTPDTHIGTEKQGIAGSPQPPAAGNTSPPTLTLNYIIAIEGHHPMV